jgi:outer membrane protein assembly factor BamE (lipoprotein component of BamABCDE complex)
MRTRRLAVIALSTALVLTGCISAKTHRDDVQNPSGDRLTVGTVQKEIRIGMSGADVAEVLGSPNIVQTDEERREVWIYDRIATDVTYSRSGGTVIGLLFGGSGGGLAGGSVNSGAESTSQRTLTVIIKFDEKSQVRDFAYHSSRF